MCKVSVIVPVCNVGQYLDECISSVLHQTLPDIELICIDDVSSDNSLEIIKKYAAEDDRLRFVAYEVNRSASQARKDGVQMATGEYIMFLDGDDFLQPDACEKLYAMMHKMKVDMLQFRTNVINEGALPKKRIANLEKLLEPYDGIIEGEAAVFEACFVEKKFRFSLWNKIYEAKFCKEAMQYVKDGFYPKAQDLYAFLVLAYKAKSYGSTHESFYNYRFGVGITGNKRMTLQQVERFAQGSYVADAVEEFLQAQSGDTYIDVIRSIRTSLLNDCLQQWYQAIPNADAACAFDIITKYWKPEELAAHLCEKFFSQRKELAIKLLGAATLHCRQKKKIETIGIFYHRYALGGVQRVISLLIPLYMELGYKVVLMTDEIDVENEYPLPSEVTRVVLPHSLKLKPSEFGERTEAFRKAIEEHHIDAICYQAASSRVLLFDMILIQLLGVPLLVASHEVSFQSMLNIDDAMVQKVAVYRLVDCLVVLSRAEETYWRTLGVNAIYIPNPIEHPLIDRDRDLIEPNTILWVGRLDVKTKRCMDLVDIMSRVVAEVPDARLNIVGNEFTKGLQKKIEKKIKKKHLEENVILCGYTTDVDSYYRRADIQMITSVSETFPMTVSESKAYGLPLVMYELPFVEMCRYPKGMLAAPQGDVAAMAEHIVTLLQNTELKERMQREAHESLKVFKEFDLKGAWDSLLKKLSEGDFAVSVSEEDDNYRVMLQSMLHHYEYGVQYNNIQKQEQKKRLMKLKQSEEYKLGQRILPRIKKITKFKNKLKAKFKRILRGGK